MNTDAPQQEGAEKLFSCIASGNSNAVARCLASKVPASSRNAENVSALAAAARTGRVSIAEMLLRAGADINSRDIDSEGKVIIPLHEAINSRRLDMVDFLLTKGANPALTDHGARTAAHLMLEVGMLNNTKVSKLKDSSPEFYAIALQKEELALSVFRRAVSAKGVVNTQAADLMTILEEVLRRDVLPKALDIVLENGAELNTPPTDCEPYIYRMWDEGHFWKLHKLIEHGADINSLSSKGGNALFMAFDDKSVRELLRLGCDLHRVDDQQRNALAFLFDTSILGTGYFRAASELIAAGIDVYAADDKGVSVERRLKRMSDPESAQLLAQAGARRAKEAISQTARSAISNRHGS